MDPDATLKEIRSLIDQAWDAEDLAESEHLLADVARKFAALDEWLTTGGFPPKKWTYRA